MVLLLFHFAISFENFKRWEKNRKITKLECIYGEIKSTFHNFFKTFFEENLKQ